MCASAALLWPPDLAVSVRGGVGVVVDVSLTPVLCLRILMALVVVVHGGVIVPVTVGRRHVLPAGAVSLVVDDVRVLVVVHELLMVVGHHDFHLLSTDVAID